jgi:Flp pilus assembly protein TadD
MLVMSVPSGAQVTPPQAVQAPEDAGGALSRHLLAIAENPRNVAALKGAGEAALELGDAQAALGFFARAEEVSPRDGSIKAGIGSALVMLEQGRSALRFFDDATDLGVPEVQIAGDRGLAFDLTGNPRRAQRDYQLALRRGEDPEVRRRLALSLAISGDRDEALKAIDDQVRRQDRAGWRTRAFVLALTGDTAGAMKVVQAVMPAQAAALAPFLARLPGLGPADRALAVNFGHFPGTGTNTVSADASAATQEAPSARLDAIVEAGRPDPAQQPLGTARSAATTPSTRLSSAAPLTQVAGTTSTASTANAVTAAGPSPEASPSSGQSPPAEQNLAALPPPASDPPPTVATPIQDISPGLTSPALATAQQAVILPIPLPASSPDDAAAPVSSAPAVAGGRFADIAALVEALPAGEADADIQTAGPSRDEPAPPKQQAEAVQATKAAAVKPQASKPKPQPAKAKPAPVREPSRIWVQIAGGADKQGLPREFARLKGLAPKLFAGMTAWTTPLRATNRLLVGPFKTEGEAQAFVNQLNKAKLAGFSWTSPSGQAIEKLSAR